LGKNGEIVSKRKAIVIALVNDAFRGNQKAFGKFMKLMERSGQLTLMKAAGMWDDSLNISYEEMKKAVSEGRPKVASQEFNVVVEAGEQDQVLQHLTGRKWQMLVAKEGSGGFVTTDVPICLTWANGADHGGLSPGFGVAGTEVIFPISTNLCLRGTFEGEENVIRALPV
jgi:hypothetical protein